VSERLQYASCFVDDLYLGIPIDAVQEVTAGLELTPVPHAPAPVSGLLNLRGQIVTAIDLRRCLQARARPSAELPVNVILRTDDGCVSLLVDHVGDVLDVAAESFEPPLVTMRGRTRELIAGFHRLETRLLLVLDLARVLAASAGDDDGQERRG